MRDLKTIADAAAKGEAVTPEEFAFLLNNSKAAMLTFLIKNNPGGVNHVLRHKLGYTFELPYQPNEQKLGRLCDVLIQRGKNDDIKAVINQTPIILSKVSPQVLQAITNYKTK